MKTRFLAIAIYSAITFVFWIIWPTLVGFARLDGFFSFLHIAFVIGILPISILIVSSRWIYLLQRIPFMLTFCWVLGSFFGVLFLAYVNVLVNGAYHPELHVTDSLSTIILNMASYRFPIWDVLMVLTLMIPVSFLCVFSVLIAKRVLVGRNLA